jgi:hypothetical protein
MNSSHASVSRRALTVVGACVVAGLVIGFFLGRFGASGPDPAPDRAGSAVAGRASSPTPAKSNPGAAPAPAAEIILADAADDPERLWSTLRTRIKAVEESGNELRDLVEIAPLILALSEDQLPGALEMLADLESPFLRSWLTRTLFMRWTELNPEGAMRAAESIQAGSSAERVSKRSALQGAFLGWAESDSDSAWNYVLAHEGSPEQLQMISAFMWTVGASNPWKAAQYTEDIENPMTRNYARTALSRQWGKSDPDAALAWVESINDELILRKILPVIIQSMAETDSERAFNLAIRAPDSLSRQRELDRVIRAVAESDPEKAFEFFQRLPEGVNAENLVSSMSMTLTSASLEQAEQLLVRISKGNVRNDSFRMFAESWSRKDPGAAQEWLGQLPAGDERDFAITGLARTIVQSDPESALAWAASIDKEYIRNRTLRGLSHQWMNSDRAAAEPWILASDVLTPEQKHQLLVR